MSRRVILGPRANGDSGIFISPPGVDAFTAPDDQLVLNVSLKVSQLLLLGRASQNGVVALGLARSPFVFLTSQYFFSEATGQPGPLRPSPPYVIGASGATATINGNGSSMTIGLASTTSRGLLPLIYQVFSQAFT